MRLTYLILRCNRKTSMILLFEAILLLVNPFGISCCKKNEDKKNQQSRLNLDSQISLKHICSGEPNIHRLHEKQISFPYITSYHTEIAGMVNSCMGSVGLSSVSYRTIFFR